MMTMKPRKLLSVVSAAVMLVTMLAVFSLPAAALTVTYEDVPGKNLISEPTFNSAAQTAEVRNGSLYMEQPYSTGELARQYADAHTNGVRNAIALEADEYIAYKFSVAKTSDVPEDADVYRGTTEIALRNIDAGNIAGDFTKALAQKSGVSLAGGYNLPSGEYEGVVRVADIGYTGGLCAGVSFKLEYGTVVTVDYMKVVKGTVQPDTYTDNGLKYESTDTSERYFYPSGDNGLDNKDALTEQAKVATPDMEWTLTKASGYGYCYSYKSYAYAAGDYLYYNFTVGDGAGLNLVMNLWGSEPKSVNLNDVLAQKHGIAKKGDNLGAGHYEGLLDLSQWYKAGDQINGFNYGVAGGTVTLHQACRVLSVKLAGVENPAALTEVQIIDGKLMTPYATVKTFVENVKVQKSTSLENYPGDATIYVPTYLVYDFTLSGMDKLTDKGITMHYGICSESAPGTVYDSVDLDAAILAAEGLTEWADGHYAGAISFKDIFAQKEGYGSDSRPITKFYFTTATLNVSKGATMQVNSLKAVNYVTLSTPGKQTARFTPELNSKSGAYEFSDGATKVTPNTDGSLFTLNSQGGGAYGNTWKWNTDGYTYLHYDFVGDLNVSCPVWTGCEWGKKYAEINLTDCIKTSLGITKFKTGVRYSGYLPMAELVTTDGTTINDGDGSSYPWWSSNGEVKVYAFEVVSDYTEQTTTAAPDFEILGASARGNEDIRFGLSIDNKNWNDGSVFYGTIMAPTDTLGGSELTFNTADVLQVETVYWQEELGDIQGIPGDLYTSVLKGVPSSARSIAARGYMLCPINGNWYVMYTNTISRSIDDVYAAAVTAAQA